MTDDKDELSYLQVQLRGVEADMLREFRSFIQKPLLAWGGEVDADIARLAHALSRVPPDAVPPEWTWISEIIGRAHTMGKLWDFQSSVGDPRRPSERPEEQPRQEDTQNTPF